MASKQASYAASYDAGDYVEVTLPRLEMHAMIAFE